MKEISTLNNERNLSKSYEKNLTQNQEIMANKLLRNVSFLNLLKPENKDLVINLTKEQKDKLASGTLKFMNKKDGSILGVLINPNNNKIEAQVSLKEVELSKVELDNINNIIIKQALCEIMKELQDLKEGINDILMGQHNDRLAKSKSAYSQLSILEHLKDNQTMREQILSKIVDTSSESFFQLSETFKYNIDKFSRLNEEGTNLLDKVNYKKSFLTNKNQGLADDIYMQLEAIIYSTMVRTMIFEELRNPIITKIPFKELTVFLDDTLSEEIIYLLNSWTDNYQDFWTKDYKKTKQKLDIKVKALEDKIDLLYLNAKENKYEEM